MRASVTIRETRLKHNHPTMHLRGRWQARLPDAAVDIHDEKCLDKVVAHDALVRIWQHSESAVHHHRLALLVELPGRLPQRQQLGSRNHANATGGPSSVQCNDD